MTFYSILGWPVARTKDRINGDDFADAMHINRAFMLLYASEAILSDSDYQCYLTPVSILQILAAMEMFSVHRNNVVEVLNSKDLQLLLDFTPDQVAATYGVFKRKMQNTLSFKHFETTMRQINFHYNEYTERVSKHDADVPIVYNGNVVYNSFKPIMVIENLKIVIAPQPFTKSEYRKMKADTPRGYTLVVVTDYNIPKVFSVIMHKLKFNM